MLKILRLWQGADKNREFAFVHLFLNLKIDSPQWRAYRPSTSLNWAESELIWTSLVSSNGRP